MNVRRWPVLRDRSGAVRGYVQYLSFDIPLFFRLLFLPRPELVIVEPPPTTGVICRIVCAIKRVPYVYFSADVASTAAKGIGVNSVVVAALRLIEAWVLRGASAVLAVSEGVCEEVIALGADTSRVTIVGTGVDTDRFCSTGPAASSISPYLVYAGTISEIHGAGIFVEAFGRIADEFPSARLKMFGDGVELASIQVRAKELASGQIDFPGRVSGDDIASWFRGAVAALASVRPGRGYDFAFATKAFASIGCGTPVIYAGVGPTRGLIQDNKLGWVADWDVEQVAEAMRLALRDARSVSERERLSNWVENHASLRKVGLSAVRAIDKAFGTASAN